MESISRRLSWNNQSGRDDANEALKKAMSEVMRSTRSASDTEAPVNVKEEGNTPLGDFAGVRPGRNIEDVERDALDHLFRSTKTESKVEPTLKSPVRNIRKLLKSHRVPQEVSPSEVLRATASTQPDITTIDPITNRRVPQGGVPVLHQDTVSFTPKTENVDAHMNLSQKIEGDGFPDDADKYGPVKWNEPDGLPDATPEEQSKKYDDLSKYRAPGDRKKDQADSITSKYDDLGDYKPVRWNEPDGLQKPTAEENSKQYKDLGRYEPTKYDDPTASRKLTPEEESKKYKDLGSYKATSWNEPNGLQGPTPEELSKNYTDLNEYGAVRWNEPDGLQQPTLEERTKNYDDLDSYGAVRWNEPNGLQKQTREELSKNYDDLDQYNAVRWNEPDGLQQPTAEELSKDYNDLGSYGAVRWNEPDGLQKATSEELSKNYNDLGEYKPVGWNEPDGLPKLTPEELSKNYEDLRVYDGPREASNSTLEAFEKTQLDTTPKGQPLARKVEVASEDPGKEYKDLNEYGPVRWNEPDGLQKLTPEELSKNYDDLHRYGAVRWNEPDGLPEPTPEEKSKHYKDVHKYAPRDIEDVPTRVHPEEASKDYKDLHSYGPIRWNEPDGLQKLSPEEKSKAYKDLPAYAASSEAFARQHPEEASKEYKDLDKYAKYENNAAITRVHPEEASKQYTDLDQYEPQSFDSPSEPYHVGSQATPLDEPVKQYDDLDRYDPQQFDSSITPYPIHPEEATKDYPDLNRYADTRRDEPSGKVDTSSRGTKPSTDYSHVDKTNYLDHLTAQEIRADIAAKIKDSEYHNTELELAKVEHEKSWDSASKDALDHLRQHAKPSTARELTGNYVRDFPEEFSTSWSTENSPSKQSLLSAEHINDFSSIPLQPTSASTTAHESSAAELESIEETEPSSMDESFPSNTFKLQPAVDRQPNTPVGLTAQQRRKRDADPYSKTPQGLETSYKEECGTTIWPALVKHYASTSSAEEAVEETTSTPEEPHLYQVLAYDPTTDDIRVAEMKSGVHDTASPLTPAEALVQLSSPARFFPYFAPLESQGYEMISGQGDVLVFRKVRDASPTPIPLPESSASTSPAPPTHPPVNPIDMMGKPPITGNFASPTGFVNYDNVAEPSDKPEPPFRAAAAASEELSSKKQEAREAHPRYDYRRHWKDRRQHHFYDFFKLTFHGLVWGTVALYTVGAASKVLSGH
jgi:hypothetical protein